ncbi:unnamed protein product [Camellia sinensis]
MVHLKGGSRPPWVGLGAAVWLQIASGNAYNFPLYSHSLKSALGFCQQQLTMLGVANDIGENVGILPGIACNKFSPCIVLLIGAFASFLGYGVLWLAVSQTVQSLPYWLLWLALCVATNSGAWLRTDVLVTNMRNFPVSRGTVAGIFSKLLLFLTLGIPTLCIVMMYAVKPLMTLYPSNRSKLGTLGRPVGSSDQLIQAEGDMGKSEPLLTPSTSTTNIGSFHESDSVSKVDMLLAEGEGAVKKKRRSKRGEDFTFREAIVKADFWLLSKTIPRTLWMTFTQIIMIITYLFFASAIDGTLYESSRCSPLLWCPCRVRTSCLGPNCFRLTFIVLAAVCAMGTVLSVVLTKRIKPVYEMLYAGGSFRLPLSSNH